MKDDDDESTTEIILSQKLKELSTKSDNEITTASGSVNKRSQTESPSSSNISHKKRKSSQQDDSKMVTSDDESSNCDRELDPIPPYLLFDNRSFIKMITKITTSNKTISMNDIQEIALLKHQIAALLMKQDITETYLQSIKGTLTEYDFDLVDIDRCVWPVEVKSLMLTHRKRLASGNAVATANELDINDKNVQRVCEDLLQQHLKERNEQIQDLKSRLEAKKQSLMAYSSIIDEMIDNFIESHGLKALKMQRDFRIAMIQHSFESEILERKYHYEKPNQYQVNFDIHAEIYFICILFRLILLNVC